MSNGIDKKPLPNPGDKKGFPSSQPPKPNTGQPSTTPPKNPVPKPKK